MKNKFTLGAIAGISSLALAVPILAQLSSAQSAPAQPATQQATGIQDSQATAPDKQESSDKEDGETPVDPSLAKISEATAKAAALQAQPGTINKTELEDENGTVVFGFEIQNGDKTVDVKVDATTGKVIKIEQDDRQKDGEMDDAKETQIESQEKNEPAGQELND